MRYVLTAAVLLLPLPASANAITYTASGVIAAWPGTAISGETWGIDGGGYFGSAGASLVGAPYAVTWTATDCECIGAANYAPLASSYPKPNPIVDVTLTINGFTYDFGGNGWYGAFYFNDQATGYFDGGSFIETSVGVAPTPGIQGSFQIINNRSSTLQFTSGMFQEAPVVVNRLASVSVPGPVAGSGLPGLLMACAGLLGWRCRANRRL